MKKQMILAFFCGAVVPLVLMCLMGRMQQEPQEVPRDTVPELRCYDREQRVAVLTENGEIRNMDLESYLVGVVLAEMPADFEPEALKAQAVVARTYTCRRMEQGRHGGAAVCTDPGCCQGFRNPESWGGTNRNLDRIREAVRSTDGKVLTYEGQLIDATYFSCSGGFTEDAVEVWGQEVPYLQAVESPGEEQAPRYRDEKRFEAEKLAEILGFAPEGNPEDWFGTVRTTRGGGVDTAEICGREFSGRELRSLLGLRSTVFATEVDGREIVFRTRGFGHRVGMSQYGAEAMAAAGSSWEEILTHYYSAAVITDLRQP